jgi:hypothetical protein
MSHMRWNLLKRVPRLGRVKTRVIWVEGYVCALEDVVKGLEHQTQTYLATGHMGSDNVFRIEALDMALEHVQAILATAQDTLRQLQALEKEIPHGE